MQNNKKKISNQLQAIISNSPSTWLEKAKWRQKNAAWLDVSQRIATHILLALKNKNMSQKDLATILDVTPQQISKIVKGQENLTLDTICKIELSLGIQIISKRTLKYEKTFEELSFNFEKLGKQMELLKNLTDQLKSGSNRSKQNETYEKSKVTTKVILFNCISVTESELAPKVA